MYNCFLVRISLELKTYGPRNSHNGFIWHFRMPHILSHHYRSPHASSCAPWSFLMTLRMTSALFPVPAPSGDISHGCMGAGVKGAAVSPAPPCPHRQHSCPWSSPASSEENTPSTRYFLSSSLLCSKMHASVHGPGLKYTSIIRSPCSLTLLHDLRTKAVLACLPEPYQPLLKMFLVDPLVI